MHILCLAGALLLELALTLDTLSKSQSEVARHGLAHAHSLHACETRVGVEMRESPREPTPPSEVPETRVIPLLAMQQAWNWRMTWFGVSAVCIGVMAYFAVPYIHHELLLQFQCHLNATEQAQENVRLIKQLQKARAKIEELRDKVQNCQDNADSLYSIANRNYWVGINMAIYSIIGLFFSYIICCKCGMTAFMYQHRPHPPPRRLGWF